MTVTDGKGGSATRTLEVVVKPGANSAPTVTAARTPTGNVRVGVPVAFTATGTDADGDTLTYAWDFGDGDTSTAAEPDAHVPGRRDADRQGHRLRRQGRHGRGDAQRRRPGQPQPDHPGDARRRRPSAGLAPLTVQLTGAATDPDGHTVSYSWDLDGDGTFETTTQNATATYNTPGTYTPTLRVTDPFGGASTRAVTVNVLGELDPAAKFKVLVFSRTAAFRHGSIGAGITAIKKLGADNGFAVDAIEEPALFTDAFLNRYDAVIFLSTTGDVLNDDQQAAFERYIRSGHGYVGIHSAADTEYGWPWYGQLVGAYFRNHPNGTPTATVVTEDASHLSTAHLPARWTRVDEWYNYQSPINPNVGGGGTDYSARNTPGVKVLLTMDESTYAEADGSDGVDDDHPISWCRRYDGGRSWYTGLGHTDASFVEPAFLQHLLGGLEVATGYKADPTCGVVETNTPGDIAGNVPATLALTIGAPASFGTFVPARRTGLRVEPGRQRRLDGVGVGAERPRPELHRHREARQRRPRRSPRRCRSRRPTATSRTGRSPRCAATGHRCALLAYTGPVSNDAVTIGFRQSIAATSRCTRAPTARRWCSPSPPARRSPSAAVGVRPHRGSPPTSPGGPGAARTRPLTDPDGNGGRDLPPTPMTRSRSITALWSPV